MDRFTISLDKALAKAFDSHIKQRGYSTRSEAVRDILRELLQRHEQSQRTATDSASPACHTCITTTSASSPSVWPRCTTPIMS